MMFGSIISSPRGSLLPQQALDLANIYLDNAWNTTDPQLTLVLCHDTEISLSQARKAAKRAENPMVLEGIASAYLSLSKLLENRGLDSEAQASFKKAEKLGVNLPDLVPTFRSTNRSSTILPAKGTLERGPKDVGRVRSPQQRQLKSHRSIVALPTYIFAKNSRPPPNSFKLPEPDERLTSTPQLVCCLGLLQTSPESILDPTARKWLQAIDKDKDEQERLKTLATEVVKAFKRDDIKDAKAVAEVVYLAPVLDKELFHFLLGEFYSEIERCTLLSFHKLEGLAQLIQGADTGYLSVDDLVKILELLSKRLMVTHQKSTQHLHHLTLAVSHVLDAMADTKITDLDREKLHEPLKAYLNELKKSPDSYLVYQAAYAYQALLCIPDNETAWQAAMRRTGKVVQGVSGLVSGVKGLDLIKFFEGLENIHKGLAGVPRAAVAIKRAYDGANSLAKGGQLLLNCLIQGSSFNDKRDWYSALRGADALIRDAEFATFKKLACEAPCRHDAAFQWGVCQRLGEVAANPMWDSVTRRNAIEFLGEIYSNDAIWGQESSVKQWILNILMQLSTSTGSSMQSHAGFTEILLGRLERCDDAKKQALYQASRTEELIAYPLKISTPEPSYPSLLDRVQNRPDVEGSLRKLRKQRTRPRENPVYIPPQAKASVQAADHTRFPLMEKVMDFLESHQKVFLLLGDSGAGKSTFSHELELQLWRSYNNTGRIPLRINLPSIDKPEHDMITKVLRKAEFAEAQIREMKQHREFILICDGYDESQQTQNLYMSNRLNQPGEWVAQMLISCRSEYLGSDYRDRFQPGDRNHVSNPSLFQEAMITPFLSEQVQSYIKQYVEIKQPLWHVEDYMHALESIPNLRDLVKNPFLMNLSLEVLPRMVEPGQHLSTARVTRVALYDHFVEQWLEREKKRLGEKEMAPQSKEVFQDLIAEGFTLNGIGYLKKFAVAIYKEQDGHPVVEYSQLVDEGSWKDAFFKRKEKLLLHAACPLARNGNQHRFIHRSLLEYSLALAIFDPHDKRSKSKSGSVSRRRGSMSSTLSFEMHASEEEVTAFVEHTDVNSPLVWRSFVNDHSLLQFLEERTQHEPVFKRQLLAYIERSKKDKNWRIAAANAITILVRAGVPFVGADLQGIKIPGADLSYGVFDTVKLQDADLRKVNFRGVWLRESDLSRSQMTGVQFGELPYLTEESNAKSCAYSPDGKSLAVGLSNGGITIYMTSTWYSVRTLNGHSEEVRRVVYSPQGDAIVSGSLDMTVRLWDTESGTCRRVLSGHTAGVNCVAYSPRGDTVASASNDKTIRLWNPTSGDCLQTFSNHTGEVLCMAYSPNRNMIVSGSSDNMIRLWSLDTGECSYILSGHSDNVWDIAFSSRGDQFASASYDRTIRLWDANTMLCRHTLSGHSSNVCSVVYSPKGDHVASGSWDGTVQIWDVETGKCRHSLNGHRSCVQCIAFSPRGDQLASGSGECTVRLWDLSVEASRFVPSSHSMGVFRVDRSPKGDQVVTCSIDGTMWVWDTETGTCLRTLRGHKAVFSAAYSPQGHLLASGGCDKTVRLWDVQTGKCTQDLDGHKDWVNGVAFSPNGDEIASASADRTVIRWDVVAGSYRETLRGHTDAVTSVMYSPDGWLIVSSSKDCTSRIWDLETGACKHTLEGHEKSVQDVVFSPQGDQLASASEDSTVRLWSVSTGECQLTLRGHHQGVLRVAYSPKGDVLASGSWDKTVRLWDVASGHCRTVIPNFQDYIGGIAWMSTTNGNYLFAGCKDGSLHKWEFIEEGNQCRLCWSGTNGVLVVTGIQIQDASGLTPLNKKLLKQRGAVGEPELLMRGAGKKVMAMAAVVSKLKQPHPAETEPESPLILSPTDVPWRNQANQQATQSGDFQDNVRGQKGDSFLV